MKKIFLMMLIPLLVITGICLAGDPPGNSPIALVKKIVKDVTYKKAGQSDWEVAKTGTPLSDGEQVKTGANSLALVLFTDGSGLLRVRENTILNIYGAKDGRKLNKNTFIEKGKLGFEVNKQEDDEFKFTTPTAVASIRGTAGLFKVDSLGTTLVGIEGLIDVSCSYDPNKHGQLQPGQTVYLNQNCELSITQSSEDDKKEFTDTKKTTNKKVKIKTSYGDIEIEYYQ
jgi:hypothetical protein